MKVGGPDMELMKIRKNYQLTIPRNFRNKFNLAEGDYVEVDAQEEFIVIKPVKIIQPDQEYFYTREWQEREAEADEDLRTANVLGPFDNAADAIKALKTAKI